MAWGLTDTPELKEEGEEERKKGGCFNPRSPHEESENISIVTTKYFFLFRHYHPQFYFSHHNCFAVS